MSLKTNSVSSGYSTGVINSNFKKIEKYVNDNLLNRDGVTPGEPNQMEANLDMNSQDILNVGEMDAKEIVLDGISLKELLGNSPSPGSGGIESIVAGSGIAVDDSDPVNPVVSATGGGGGVITAEQVKQLYESNPDTNAFTDADVLTLAGIPPQIDGINKLIGDIGSALDAINGEVV